MKYVTRMPIPWDAIVFLTITCAGFAFSVQRLLSGEVAFADSRQLASIGTTSDLGCLEEGAVHRVVETDRGSVRLSGRLCRTKQGSAGIDSVEVLNQRNHSTGTVFLRPEEQAFITDYLALDRGENTVVVRWMAEGKSHELTALVRQAAPRSQKL